MSDPADLKKISERIPPRAVLAAVLAGMLLCGCTKIHYDIPITTEEPVAKTILRPDEPEAGTDTESDAYIDTDSRYIYYTLSKEERVFYDELKAAAEDFSPAVRYSSDIDAETAKKIFIAVYNQEPQLFWLDSIFYAPSDGSQPLSYRFSREEAEKLNLRLEQTAADILKSTDGKSDYEKVLAFHDKIVLGCSFSENDRFSGTAYGALCGGYAQCEGYAFAFKYLCSLADINCITVTGTKLPEGSTHAWNIVMLDGIWYNVDCTWDDPILKTENDGFIRHNFMLVPDSDILGITHVRSSDYYICPECYDGSRTYYAREGLLADSAAEGITMLRRSAETALMNGSYEAEVRFDSSSAYYAAVSQLFSFNDISNVISDAAASAGLGGTVNTRRYVRYLSDSLYIIHITMLPSE